LENSALIPFCRAIALSYINYSSLIPKSGI